MMNRVRAVGIACLVLVLGCVTASLAADREKLLSDPGVYGTFAAFRIDPEWGRLEQSLRISQLTAMRGVVEQHREKLAIDAYLLRGLSDHADFLLRVHGTELKDPQQFLVDLQNSAFGRYLTSVVLFNGVTKKPNYVPGFPEQLRTTSRDRANRGPMSLSFRFAKTRSGGRFRRKSVRR